MNKLIQTNPESDALPAVEAAVNWWVSQLTGKMRGGSVGDDLDALCAMVMADQIFSQTQINEKQISTFRDVLSRKLMIQLSQGIEPTLGVDYEPSGILCDAMIESVISFHLKLQ